VRTASGSPSRNLLLTPRSTTARTLPAGGHAYDVTRALAPDRPPTDVPEALAGTARQWIGWGVAVERAGGLRVSGVLVVPLGLAAAIVVASLLTAFRVTAPAATPLVGLVAAVGLVVAQPFRRLALWPAVTALGVMLAYGAPVLLSGSATFLGYFRLDDTAQPRGLRSPIT
jgi:hypothetical protein